LWLTFRKRIPPPLLYPVPLDLFPSSSPVREALLAQGGSFFPDPLVVFTEQGDLFEAKTRFSGIFSGLSSHIDSDQQQVLSPFGSSPNHSSSSSQKALASLPVSVANS